MPKISYLFSHLQIHQAFIILAEPQTLMHVSCLINHSRLVFVQCESDTGSLLAVCVIGMEQVCNECMDQSRAQDFCGLIIGLQLDVYPSFWGSLALIIGMLNREDMSLPVP